MEANYSSISSVDINRYVVGLRKDIRATLRDEGLKPQFIPGFTINITKQGNVVLHVWYRVSGQIDSRSILL